ncbi:hypothetical protein FYK55_03850 [Roseiconus nitratireducens]|uniref:DNA topoisomerase (ATP-hydrolyzing) n=1 Tax=Roseiconus nitratireducens TaxID=2605748 RepID=A0A5M6DI54_9BACT|nr:toprim domain-containing protein [Roseiconus nitratireducens]KAA5546046.1 hypothetical protein FYK55_03850 [Roseiconus nitratireducens]
MTWITQHTKLIDCRSHGPGSELLLVEGDSASRSVARLRNERCQAVLPMQGKPMNAAKASEKSVRRNPWYEALIKALGVGWNAENLDALRYERVLFLFDPDADGIHCGALMLIFFDQYLRPLLDQRRVSLIKAPLFRVSADGYRDAISVYSEEHLARLRRHLDDRKISHSHQRYRGLASIDAETLQETCIDPDSRTAYLLQHSDAESARQVFGKPAKRTAR